MTPPASQPVSINTETDSAAEAGTTGLKAMQRHGHLTEQQFSELIPVASQFGVAITPAMLGQLDPENPADPVAAQFVPTLAELDISDDETTDPIGDHAHMPVKGVIHRYPDRVLLTPVHVCPVYCRFCFRREDVGQTQGLTAAELDAALDYIAGDKKIWEVILSGGDPLILSPRRLGDLLKRLRNIEHVKVIRIHTRVPVVSPEKITAELIATLQAANPVYTVIHTNHAQEFSEAARDACNRLADAGLPLLSQTVLLKGINDNAQALGELMRLLVEHRIKPYYLHHADKARGTGHFRTGIAEGRALMRELRGNYSGLCQPEYVLDIPGGAGKAPVGPEYIQETESSTADPLAAPSWQVEDYTGGLHRYTEPRTAPKK